MSGIYIYTKGLNYLEFIRYFNVWHYVMQVGVVEPSYNKDSLHVVPYIEPHLIINLYLHNHFWLGR